MPVAAPGETQRISVRVPADVLNELHVALAVKRSTLQEVMCSLITGWLDENRVQVVKKRGNPVRGK